MKTVLEQMKDVLDSLRALPASRARGEAIKKLEECAFWASAAIAYTESPIDTIIARDRK